MSRLLKITDNGNGILVQGTDNILYPNNATLTFPYNSIILVTDESNIATFRSASNNDVLFSGLIGNIEIGSATVTKANIIEKFDEIANQASGGGGGEFDPTQYYTKSQTNALLDEKADESDIPTDISELNNDAGYITQDEVIINESFPISWLSAQSMSELITAINNDSDAVVGKVYMDTISLSDLPAGMLQAEVKAEIMSELSGEKVILFTVTSSNTSPYHWEYTSAYGDTGSWREWVTPQQLATVATSGSYNDLSNKPTIPTVPTNVSAFVNDVPYLTQHQDISAYFNGAEYDSNTKRINFKNGNNVIAYIDATAFIKDGMVDTVAISNGNLVITFNTDAGKQPISIPLTDIFNPANYYDKTATDTLLAAKANSSDLATVATSGSYDDLSDKPTIPSLTGYATESWVQQQGYAESSDLSTVATSGSYNDLSDKPTIPDASNYYTKTETDNKYLTNAVFDVKEQTISAALNDLDSGKQDTLVAGTNISIQGNVISASGSASQIQSDWAQNDSNSVDYIKNKPDLSVYAESANLATVATSGSYNDLSDKPTIPSVSDKADKVANATSGNFAGLDSNGNLTDSGSKESDFQSTLVSGTNIKTINNESILGSGNITIQGGGTQVQSDWNQTDSSAVDYIKNKPNLATVATSGSYNDLSNKPTIPTVPTNVSAFTNDAGYLTQHQSLANYYTKSETDSAINTAIGNIDLSDYVDKETFDTKEEVISTALNVLDTTKQDVLTAGANITIQNNVISSTGGTQVQADWNQSDSTAVDYIKNKPTIPDTSDFVTITQYNNKEIAIAEALTDLNENKADKSEIPVVPDMTNYYTKTEIDAMIGNINTILASI